MGVNLIEHYPEFAYLVIVLAGIFSAFVLNLLIFHSVLLCLNVTTWEFLSWNKISYLSEWPKKLGSPWNLGVWNNIKIHLCYRQAQGDFFIWKMPNRLP
jgi:palmitoyltransferase